MESQPGGHNPLEDGFRIQKQDLSIGDQADLYLKVSRYDKLKYGFCDKYGYRLGETALILARYENQETVIYDGVRKTEEVRELYEQALEAALMEIPLNHRERWMSEFLSDLNNVHEVALALNIL